MQLHRQTNVSFTCLTVYSLLVLTLGRLKKWIIMDYNYTTCGHITKVELTRIANRILFYPNIFDHYGPYNDTIYIGITYLISI